MSGAWTSDLGVNAELIHQSGVLIGFPGRWVSHGRASKRPWVPGERDRVGPGCTPRPARNELPIFDKHVFVTHVVG